MNNKQKGYSVAVIFFLIIILWIIYPANIGIIVLEYHSISNIGGLYCLPPEFFEQQMQYLAENGYTTISLDQMSKGLKDYHTLPAKPVLLTFDDGYADNYLTVLPILKKYNMNAAVFIITDKVGQSGYLNWEQILTMLAHGIDIGSHTVTHRALPTLNAMEQEQELKVSKDILEEKLRKPITYISYPFGGFNNDTLHILRSVGYQGGFSGIPGINMPGANPYILKRILMLNTPVGLQHFKVHLWKLEILSKIQEVRSFLGVKK